MDNNYYDRIKAIERVKAEKWKQHNETDIRESLIDEYEKENGLLTPEQLEKVRAIYNSYLKDGREFKKEYIDIIKSIIRDKKQKVEDDKEDFDSFRI